MKWTNQRTNDEIPTSSMADIAFLLIIYFMVTATFTATRGLDLEMPAEEEERSVSAEEGVLVEILPLGDLVVDSKPMQRSQLLDYLRPRLTANPDKPVILLPRPDTPYGHMLELYDLLRQGKVQLDLKQEIGIAIPTRREIEQYWS